MIFRSSIVILSKRSLRREGSGRAARPGRVLCDPLTARLARLLLKLHRLPEGSMLGNFRLTILYNSPRISSP